jgi:ribosome maturation factor RimP
MITEQSIRKLAGEHLEGGPVFLVEVVVKPGNHIHVHIDGDQGVTVADCQSLHRYFESRMDRDAEDYDLTVSSAGADHPLVLARQYPRHVGRTLEIRTSDGKIRTGKLKEVTEDSVLLEIPGTKKVLPAQETILLSNIAEARVLLSFK